MDTEVTNQPAATGVLARHEGKLIVAFAILLLGVNVWTSLFYPTCWMDEVMFTDPAIHAVRGEGLVSTAWWQSKEQTWSGNVPLYTCALAPWFKAVGIGLVRARAFNYAVISLTIVIFWLAVRRLNATAAAGARLALIVTVFLSYSFCMPYRVARPDCLGMLISAVALLAWTWRGGGWRNAVLFSMGVLAPCSGLQLAAFLGFVCALVVWARGRSALLPLGFLLAGMIAGFTALCVFYYVNHLDGVWQTLQQARRLHAAGEMAGQTGEVSWVGHWLLKAKRICLDQLTEHAILPALVALGILACDRAVRRDRQMLRLVAQAVGASVLMVSVLEIFLHYLDYYHWMNFIILMMGVFVVISRKWRELNPWTRAGVRLALLGVALAGLPLRAAVGYALGQAAEYAQLQAAVRQNVDANDIVFTDFMGYFPARARARQVYAPPYFKAFNEQERRSVNVLILDPINFDGYQAEFSRDGQRWRTVAEVPAQSAQLAKWWLKLFPNYRQKPTNCGYRVTILRREPDAVGTK